MIPSRSNAARTSIAARLIAIAAAVLVSTTALAAGQIAGAGSTWVYPLLAKWAAAYRAKTGIQVNYQSIGSGGGIAQIEAGTVAFGASDKPLTPRELRRHHLIQFPTAVAGEDIVYNLPGIQAGQLILSGPVVAEIDHRVSHWGRTRNPVFGSKANASLWSDRLRSASVAVDIGTVLLTPSGDVGGTWLLDKTKGYLVNLAAATTAIEAATLLQRSVRRERPNGANDHSFPSGHSAASSVYTRLATLNLEEIPMGSVRREALEASLHALSFATAWARVEGGWHYPSDTLASMAIGNFCADFFTSAFMGIDEARERFAFSSLPGGGAFTFAVALRAGS